MSDRRVANFIGADGLYIARRLGLTEGLQLVLDAGNDLSYASGQSWLDLSGNGYDFFLGANGSANASDPTFNGTAGRMTAGEYFSVDGSDWFTYDSTNETWMQNLHKNNAVFTVQMWVYLTTIQAQRFIGTVSTSSEIGFRLGTGSGGDVIYTIGNGSGTAALTGSTSITTPSGAWFLIGCTIDEASAAGYININGVFETFSSTYSSPSASNATYTMNICSGGGQSLPLANNSRIAMVAFWGGRFLTQAEITYFFNLTKVRFGL